MTVLLDSRVENRLSLHRGPMSIVEDIKDKLLQYITHWRERGFPVTRKCLVCKVCTLKPEFLEKSVDARKIAISCFLCKNNMTHRVASSTCIPQQAWRGQVRPLFVAVVPTTSTRVPTKRSTTTR